MAHSQHILIKPKPPKRTSISSQLNTHTQILNLRKQLNQYLHQQQIINSTQQLKHRRNTKSIKDYLTRWYSKDRKSDIVRKKIVIQQQSQPFQEKNISFNIKQIKPRRKGCHPYNIDTSEYDQVFKNDTTKMLAISKRNIIKSQKQSQNKSKNYHFIFAHHVPSNKRYSKDQSSNFVTSKNQTFINQKLKPIQLQPWPKDNQQYTIFDF